MSLVLALALCVLGCDAAEVSGPDPSPFDPDTVDFDQVQRLSFSEYVQPLLAARDAFAPEATDEAGDLADYAWDAIFASEAGATIVPFDEEGSLLIRFVEDLPEDAAIPYPNLRRLQDDEVRYLKRWVEAGAKNDAGHVPYADSEHLLFAAIQGENHVAIIDAQARRVIRRIYLDDHGIESRPYGPHHIVFAPDASAWYVSLISAGVVAKLSMDLTLDPSDPAYLLAASDVPGGFTTPGMMALDAHAGRLYVGRSTLSSANTFGIGVFDPASLALIDEFPLTYDIPHALALTPDGRFLITAPLNGQSPRDNVVTVDAASGDVVAELPLALGHVELVHANVLPDGSTATLTANSGGASQVLFFEIGEDGTLTPRGSAPTGDRAWHAHLDADGQTLLVPNRSGNSVTLIDVPSGEVRMTAENPPGGPIAMPHSPAPTVGGAFFVSNSNLQGTWAPPYAFLDEDPDGDGIRQPLPSNAFGNVAVLNAETGAVEAVIQLGAYPSGLEHYHGGHHGH